jgi:hypothetical protein
LGLLAVTLFLTPANLQAATKPKKVLVFQVQSDSLGETDRAAATKSLREAIAKYPGVKLLDTPTVDFFELMIEFECTDTDADCLAAIGGKKFKAHEVVHVQAEPAGGGISLHLKVVNVRKRKLISEQKGTAASASAAGSGLAALVVAAMGAVPAPKPPPPPRVVRVRVKITANVKKATVYINGKKMGRAPLTRSLKAGNYKVKVTRRGYSASERTITVGTSALAVNFDLAKTPKAVAKTKAKPVESPAPAPAPQIESDRPFYAQWWFWTAVGVGVAGIVTTAVVLSIDGEPAKTGIVNFGLSSPDYDPLVLGVE